MVTINEFFGSGFGFAAIAPASVLLGPVTSAANDNVVSLAAPQSLTATEVPLGALVGAASTTFFGVTDADLAAMAAAAAQSSANDVLAQDFAILEPSLANTNKVTKAKINWS